MERATTYQAVLGIDVGIHFTHIALLDRLGHIHLRKKYSHQNYRPNDLPKALITFTLDFLSNCITLYPEAIGIGLIGHTDFEQGIWLYALNIPINGPIPLAKILSEAVGLPVYIDNNLHAATLAENYFGIGRTCKDFIFIYVDQGIAAGFISGGYLIRGGQNAAGEIGHMCVETNGAPCKCGSFGCLESIVSGQGLIEQVEQGLRLYPHSSLSEDLARGTLCATSILEAATEGDALALSIYHRSVKALGIALINITNLFNPTQIVFSGPIIENEAFLEDLKSYVLSHLLIGALTTLKDITLTYIPKDDLHLLGAGLLPYETQKRNRH